MTYLLFPCYLILFSALLYYLAVKNHIQVDGRIAIASFLLKVAMGCLYGYIFLHYYGGDDTWRYHYQSQEETALLMKDPLKFFTSLFDLNDRTSYSAMFESVDSYWKELEYVLLIKLIAIFNLFSGGHYYINVIWFSFLSFWGGYYFYRLFNRTYPGYEKSMAAVFLFFIPMVFWTSGIRKDGLIFLFLGLIFYHFQLFLSDRKWPRIMIITLSLFMLFLIRNFVALTLLPALLAWGIATKGTKKAWQVFSLVYGISLVLFFLSAITGPVNFPRKITERQFEFFRLKGGSHIQLDSLHGDPLSYIRILPQALNHVFLRPYPGEQASLLFRFSSLESWFCIFLFLLLLLYPAPAARGIFRSPFMMTIIFYSLNNYLLIGYTIPFLGAIVRYRIIFETLLLAVITLHIRWKSIPLIKSYIN